MVRRLLTDAQEHGAGRRYLIQHSAGSGKSNSIAWLAYQLIRLQKNETEVFESIIVVTDRRLLDQQIRDTIKHFAQVKAVVGHAKDSGDLRRFIESGKKIIITTVQKFPFILNEIGNEPRGRRFAIIIDEAHSSQGGKTSAALSLSLSEAGATEDGETTEDIINRLMDGKKLLTNASYFAFTATPKNKTLEIFGEPLPQTDGTVKHVPFHSYTMKQAIQEGFILDVLKNYTPVNSYYRLVKTAEGDPEFDTKKHRKNCAAMWKVMIMRFVSRPRLWWITSMSRYWHSTRSVDRHGRWSSPAASNGPYSISVQSGTISLSARARIRPSSHFQVSMSMAG